MRAVAQADGSVGRIVDGHYNAVERIELLAAEPLRSAHLEEVAAGQRWLGVWGADPVPGEGEPARVVAQRRRAGPRRRQDLLLGCRRPARRARAGARRRRPPRRLRRPRRGRRDRPHVVRQRRHARLREPPRALPRRAACTRCSAVPTSCCASRGSDATPSARPRAGRASPTRRAPRRSRRSRRGRSPATTWPRWPWAASTPTRRRSTCGWPRPGAARTLIPTHRCGRCPCTCARRWPAPRRRSSTRRCGRAGSRPLARGGALDRAARDLRIFLLQHRLDPLLVRAGREAVDR